MSRQKRGIFRSHSFTAAPDIHSQFRFIAGTFLGIAVLLCASCGFLDTTNQDGQSLALAGSFPNGVAHQSYNAVLTVNGGTPPYQFVIKSGTLPAGLTLNSSTGSVSGTPTAAGDFSFEIGVTDAPNPHQGSRNFAISVSNGGIHVAIAPANVSLTSGQTQVFTATVTGTDKTAVTWAATAGSITAGGVYAAPTVSSQTTVWVTATSTADSKQQGVANVVVEPLNNQPLTILTSSLPDGHANNPYSADFSATGGTQPYTWSISNGTPPQGLNLVPATGELSGTPPKAGAYSFTILVTDAKKATAHKGFALSITASGGNFDGPAELPRVYLKSSLADTPAPGGTTFVAAGGDLQAALRSANCGDTIQLQAGATFTGTYKLPAKSCDDEHWIIIRTSAPDSSLPPEGTRLTPCYAGVASLNGRPAYDCQAPKNELARITAKGNVGPLWLDPGASHYRLIGLEITRPPSGWIFALVNAAGTADRIVLDRVWMHGTTQDETSRGIYVDGMTNIAIVDSYFSDFHCTSVTGTCTDAQAIAGGSGDTPAGPFKIVNNYLEASGESILFGGGPSTTTPADIEIRHNHLFKPMIWMPGAPGFVGGYSGRPFVVKNHFELKNAQRVLFEGNVLENTWGGFSQAGYSILLTPRAHVPPGTEINKCPTCQVTDVTLRYNTVSHVGAGIQIENPLNGHGAGIQALHGERYSIHDIVIDDVNAATYTGPGTLILVLNNWPRNVLNSLSISHITGFPDPTSHVFTLKNLNSNPTIWGVSITNNLLATGRYPVWSAGGGSTNCAADNVPVTSFATCFVGPSLTHNVLIDAPQAFPPSKWPSGNLFPSDAVAVQFVHYNNGAGGDYHLRPTSPYKNAGTDGKDMGADIDAVQAAIAGVK